MIRTQSPAQPVEFCLPWGPLVIWSDGFQAAAREEETKAKAEAVRLAYVATTRACDQLTLLCAVSRNNKIPEQFRPFMEERSCPSHDAPGWAGALRIRLSTTAPEYSHHTTPALTLPDEKLYRELWRERFEKLNQLPDFPLARPSRSEMPEPEIPVEEHPPQFADPVLTGQLVHAYLERWLLDEAFERDKLVSLWRRLSTASDDVLRDARSVLCLFYTDQLPGATSCPYRQRARGAEVLAREMPFFMSARGKVWNGVIDLVLEENGGLVGVDYKTSLEKEVLPESYAQQASVYTEALQQLFPGKPVRFEFWWLLPRNTAD